MLEYLTRIYKSQIKDCGIFFPVIPIVIYNGRSSWSEPQRFSESFAFITPELIKYIPDYKYILIDERRFSDRLLKKLKNAVAYFFLLDKTDLKQRGKAENRIISILQELRKNDTELFELLGKYIAGLIEYRRVELSGINCYSKKRAQNKV